MHGSEARLRTRDFSREAEWLRALANPVRIKLLAAMTDKARNVRDLVEVTGLPQSTVSQHLRVLRKEGIVNATQSGREAHYDVAEPSVLQILRYLGITTFVL